MVNGLPIIHFPSIINIRQDKACKDLARSKTGNVRKTIRKKGRIKGRGDILNVYDSSPSFEFVFSYFWCIFFVTY